MDEKTMSTAERDARPVNGEKLREFDRALAKYKAGKSSVERRAVAAENWWKLRNQTEIRKETDGLSGFKAKSGWLHNVIVAKHADATEAFPEPNILAREPDDVKEAGMLSKIVPVVLDAAHFEEVYSDCAWQKLKTGTGIYKVYWDADKLNGLGDIAIDRVDVLNVFWEPGVTDIQDSKYFFHTAMMDNEVLKSMYPQLEGKLNSTAFVPAKYSTDDSVPTDGKSVVIDCYYKKREQGRTVLHYCKYVGNEILYSTENEGAAPQAETPLLPGAPVMDALPIQAAAAGADAPGMTAPLGMDMSTGGGVPMDAPAMPGTMMQGSMGIGTGMPGENTGMAAAHLGLYDHGMYPFVFDVLFPVEGSPCGYGYIDLCQNDQMQIDLMQTAFIKNTMVGAMPRYFARMEGSINEDPNWGFTFMSVVGDSYENALEDGASEEQASLYAILNAAYNATTEIGGTDDMWGGLQKLPKNIRDALDRADNSVLLQIVKGIPSEMSEEIIQGIGESGLKSIYKDAQPDHARRKSCRRGKGEGNVLRGEGRRRDMGGAVARVQDGDGSPDEAARRRAVQGDSGEIPRGHTQDAGGGRDDHEEPQHAQPGHTGEHHDLIHGGADT